MSTITEVGEASFTTVVLKGCGDVDNGVEWMKSVAHIGVSTVADG